MRLELSELLACPACGPGHGVIVSVDRMEGRRVLEGFLSCPRCEARFPVRSGVIDFRDARAGDPSRRVAAGSRGEGGLEAAPGPEAAVALAALLDLGEGAGFVLLGPGLAGVAAEVARLAADVELVVLATPPAETLARPRVSPVLGAPADALPLYDGRLRGAALLGGPVAALGEAARAVREGGRVVVLEPAPGLVEAAAGLGLDVVAAEQAALVASRR